MSRWLSFLQPRFWGKVGRAVVGEVSYVPPSWPGGVFDTMRRHPGAWAATIVAAGVITGGGLKGYDWWQAHKPRPRQIVEIRQVTSKVSSPGVTRVVEGVSLPAPVEIAFSQGVARLDWVKKDKPPGIALSPERPGKWEWLSDSRLVFKPATDWPAGTDFVITLDAAQLQESVKLKDSRWTFTTPALRPQWSNLEFYTDPQDPEVHQITAELNFTHPVKLADVEKHLGFTVIGGAPLFNWGGVPPAAVFMVEEGKDQRRFFVRSSRIVIPEKEDFVRLALAPGLQGQTGGKPTSAEESAKVRVPDVTTGFDIERLSTELIRTSEGTPEQFVFVDTSGYSKPEEIAGHVEAWVLPKDRSKEGEIEAEEDHVWQKPGEVTDKVLKLSKPVKLTPVETEKDEAAPVAKRHGFKFVAEKPGYLFLRVTAGVKALGGFRLAKPALEVAAIPEFPKEVEIQGKGGVLALNGERKISIKSRAAKHLRITLARVPAGQVNHLVTFSKGDFQSPAFYEGLDVENLARFHREVIPVASKNDYEASYSVFDFSEALKSADASDPDASRGLFFVTVEAVEPRDRDQKADDDDADGFGDPIMTNWVAVGGSSNNRSRNEDGGGQAQRFVLISDLGLLVKRSADGTRDLFVQSVSQSGPVAGATITALATNGQFLAQIVTDADGHARLSGDLEKLQHEKKPVAFTARLGNDLAFIPFSRPDRLLDFSRFDTGGLQSSDQGNLSGFVFTERGVYRPGDTVHVAAIVRQLDWGGKLEGLPVEMDLLDAKDQVARTEKFTLPADGCIEWNVATAETDPTGQCEVDLYLVVEQGRRERLGRTAFRVEDFQPDRMKLTAAFNTAPDVAWVQPRDVKAILKVETLFGQPAADRRVLAKMYLSPASFAFTQYPDFTFHDRGPLEFKRTQGSDDETDAGKKVDLGEKQSGQDGTAQFDLALERFDGGSFQLSLAAEAFEAGGGRSVQAGKSLMISPMPYVIGYHSDTPLEYIGKDASSALKLICLAPDLKLRAAPELTASIIRIRYVSVLTKRENGNYAYVSTKREKPVSEAKFAIPAAGARFDLPSKEAGEYRFELRDPQGVIVCSTPFTIVGKGNSERSMDREAELNLKLSRGIFKDGESMEMNLLAPYTGGGLITVERDNVLAWKWFKSTTPTTVQQIPLPPGLDGTGYVSVAFVRGLDSPEVFISPLSYAVQPFTANPDRHRLTVQLDAPQKVKPGDVLKIGYSTAKPGRVVIFAVDEGIHQITNYKLPQPLEHFNRKRALETQTYQLLDLILPEFSKLTQKASGGDGDELNVKLNPFKRRKDAPVVFWSGLVAADAQRREVTYTVPDYFDGRLKIMAVALADETVGAAETQCLSRGPLVVTPNVPTFAAPGDEFTASLTVANNLEGANAAGAVQINVSASEQIEFAGPSQVTLQVAPGHEATTTFRLKAKDVLGGAEITFRTAAGDEKVERHATLSVRPAAPYLTEVQSGWFRLAKQDVKLDRVVYPHFRKSEATVSILPLGLARGLEAYLQEYPHGCSEQITSRAMSRLLLAGEVDFGFDAGESARQLEHAFALLRTRQGSHGGFGYWASDETGNAAGDFLSVYVSHFLIEAADASQAVPGDMLDRAKERLRLIARAPLHSRYEADIQAHAIYLLTRSGEVTTKYLLNLRDSVDKEWPGKWNDRLCAPYMAATYHLLKQHGEGLKLMNTWWQTADKTPRLTSWYERYFTNPTVDQAQGFALLCLHFPELAKNLGYDDLKMITEPINANRFNTLSAAYSVLALKAYSKLAAKADVKLSISALPVSGDPQLILPEGTGVRSAPFAPGLGGIRFHLDKGTTDFGAFYQATESGFDRGTPAKEIADGLEVSRALMDKDGKPVTKLKVGETATMTLRVRNNSVESLNDIALLDLMPGGFELVAGGLKPGLNALPGADYVDVREDRNVIYLQLGKAQSRTFSYPVKPVCAGRFTIPPVFAECMYDRAVKGRNGAGSVVVE